jgi:hypothetical protein
MMTSFQRRFRTDVRVWACCFIGLALATCWFELFPDFRLWMAWLLIPLSFVEMFRGLTSGIVHLVLGLTVAFSHAVLSWFAQYSILVVWHWKEERASSASRLLHGLETPVYWVSDEEAGRRRQEAEAGGGGGSERDDHF